MHSESQGDVEVGLFLGRSWNADHIADVKVIFVPRIEETVEMLLDASDPRQLTVLDVRHSFIDDLCHVQLLVWPRDAL